MTRSCVDCGFRWTPNLLGPWLDPMICPSCGGDETTGIPPSLEDELRTLSGETA